MVNRLPPLQRALARRLVEQAPGFFLAWEAALWVHGGHRSSESLELHATHAEDTVLSILSAEVEAFAREQSCDVRHSGTPVVSRFELSRAGARCVTTLRLQQLVLDPHRAEFDGVPVSTRREVRAWLLGRLVGEESTGVLADLALLLEEATHRETLADAWSFRALALKVPNDVTTSAAVRSCAKAASQKKR